MDYPASVSLSDRSRGGMERLSGGVLRVEKHSYKKLRRMPDTSLLHTPWFIDEHKKGGAKFVG